MAAEESLVDDEQAPVAAWADASTWERSDFKVCYTVHRVLARHNKGECCKECPGGACESGHQWRVHFWRWVLNGK